MGTLMHLASCTCTCTINLTSTLSPSTPHTHTLTHTFHSSSSLLICDADIWRALACSYLRGYLHQPAEKTAVLDQWLPIGGVPGEREGMKDKWKERREGRKGGGGGGEGRKSHPPVPCP